MALAVATASCLQAIAWAQDVHKCVADGHVTYQSEPCPRDDQVVHVWQSTPTAADAAAEAARVQVARKAVASDVAPASAAKRAASTSSPGASAPPHRHR